MQFLKAFDQENIIQEMLQPADDKYLAETNI